MKTKSYFRISLVLAFLTGSVHAQDVLFSSPDYTQLSLNPGLAGCVNETQATLCYRNQWKRLGTSFNTIKAEIDHSFNAKKRSEASYFGAGLDFYSDNSSVSKMNTVSIKANIAYHLWASSHSKISFGMYSGYLGISTGLEDARWGSQYTGLIYDGALNSGENITSGQDHSLDMGTGIVYSYKKWAQLKVPTFQAGLSAYHVNHPDVSIYSDGKSRLPLRFSSFINLNIPIAYRKGELKPAIYFSNQGNFINYMVGSMIGWKLNETRFASMSSANDLVTLNGGVFYRSTGALIGRMAVQRGKLSIGVTYDMKIGTRTAALSSKGASEVFLRYVLPNTKISKRY